MNIKLKSIHIENFKGAKEVNINFSDNTTISGANATGKTTIFDAATWLLFNKDSLGVEKFNIRPIDRDGKQIDFVEIFVSAIFDKDGEEFSLEKRQKQKWTKHVGEEVSKFTGNLNEYSVNGFPKTEQEYKSFIASFIDEDVFKLLSNPNYFAGLKWKDQREILMKFATTKSDLDIAIALTGFEDIIPEFEKGANTNDVQAKYKKALKEYKDKQKELPIRIDELTKQKVDYDVAELELAKKALEEKIAENSGKYENELERIKSSIMERKFKLSMLANQPLTNDDIKRNEIRLRVAEAENAALAQKNKYDLIIRETEGIKSIITRDESEIDRLGKEYFILKDKVFDKKPVDVSDTCPACGQKLPPEKVAATIASFKEKYETERREFDIERSSKMKDLVTSGNELKAKVIQLKATVDENTTNAETALNEYKKLLANVDNIKAELAAIKPSMKAEDTPEYKTTVEEIAALEKSLSALFSQKMENDMQNTSDSCELDAINAKLAQTVNNDKVDERIDALKSEQRDMSQKVADCEKILYLIDEFIKAKLELISNNINGNFEKINFKLFNILVNGGVEECCEMTYDGVPYSSLNSGMKIVGGLDVIKTLSNFYDKKVFVFVDNAETVNKYNLPDMECQIIRLVVTDDKELIKG